jgi:uncharacterized protein YjbI with pentapeptide repeats
MATEDKGLVPSEKNTGMPKRRSKWPNTPAKLIKLLGTPLTILIAVFGLLWGVYQFNIQQQSAQQQQLAQQQQVTLESYLDHMSSLLPDLLTSKEGDDVRAIARAQTLTALLQLDPERKRILLLFLYLAKLIDVVTQHDIAHLAQQKFTTVSLFSADLTNADLSRVDIHGTFLREVNLEEANLNGALLYECNLYQASLSSAKLEGANLNGTYLESADLRGANLTNAKMKGDDLQKANLSGTGTILVGASLSEAYLESADLRGANLIGADLSFADLHGANLTGTDLSFAYLRGALVTKDQLAEAESLKGAIMPDGSKHP